MANKNPLVQQSGTLSELTSADSLNVPGSLYVGGTLFVPGLVVGSVITPVRVDVFTTGYNGATQVLQFIPVWSTIDPMSTKAIEEIQWQKSTDAGTTWTDLDGGSGTWTTEAQALINLTSGTIMLQCRAKGANGDTTTPIQSANIPYVASTSSTSGTCYQFTPY